MIQWFPGHMTKALRMMAEESKKCDVFIYVLDSRAPKSCFNPEFIKLVGEKPIIYVLNKYDLADQSQTDKWHEYLANMPNSVAVKMNATESKCGKVILSGINRLLCDKIEKNKLKGVNFIFRAMVIGVPNCGKSTLINNLCGKARAITGDKAGVTRSKQWVKLTPTLEVMDSPGTLWPSFADEMTARHLGYIGSIKDEIIDVEKLAFDFVKDIMTVDMSILTDRYSVEITDDMTAIEIYEAIGRKRGCMLKKDEVDYTRVAKLIINDFRKGAMGKITLERYDENDKYI